jgi:3-dehydroquinate dehydratase
MAVNGPRIDDLNSRVNTVVGLKKYQQIKQVMSEFDLKLRDELNKQTHKVDHKIK